MVNYDIGKAKGFDPKFPIRKLIGDEMYFRQLGEFYFWWFDPKDMGEVDKIPDSDWTKFVKKPVTADNPFKTALLFILAQSVLSLNQDIYKKRNEVKVTKAIADKVFETKCDGMLSFHDEKKEKKYGKYFKAICDGLVGAVIY